MHFAFLLNPDLLYVHDKLSTNSDVRGLKQAANAEQTPELYSRLWHTARAEQGWGKLILQPVGWHLWNVKLTLTIDWLLCLRAEQGLELSFYDSKAEFTAQSKRRAEGVRIQFMFPDTLWGSPCVAHNKGKSGRTVRLRPGHYSKCALREGEKLLISHREPTMQIWPLRFISILIQSWDSEGADWMIYHAASSGLLI